MVGFSILGARAGYTLFCFVRALAGHGGILFVCFLSVYLFAFFYLLFCFSFWLWIARPGPPFRFRIGSSSVAARASYTFFTLHGATVIDSTSSLLHLSSSGIRLIVLVLNTPSALATMYSRLVDLWSTMMPRIEKLSNVPHRHGAGTLQNMKISANSHPSIFDFLDDEPVVWSFSS